MIAFLRAALVCLVAVGAMQATAATRDIPTTQKQYRLVRDAAHGYKLELTDATVRLPGEHEVLIRVRATSLNRRDVFVMKGQYPVGSRENFEALNAFIEKHSLKPIIDKVFDFKDAPAAYELMESDQFLGKIVIRL